MFQNRDTIAAQATAAGEGGVAIVRVSGADCRRIISRVFRAKNGKPLENRVLTYGYVMEDGGVADDKIGIAEIVRRVADGDGNAQRAQVLHGGGVVHVAALHGESHGMQDLGERAHRHAADAGEVRPLAGYEIGIDIHSVFLPKSTHSDSLRHLPKSARK